MHEDQPNVKDAKDRRRHGWIVVAIVGGGGVVAFVLFHGSSTAGARPATPSGRAGRSTTSIAPHSMNFAPNPANPQLEESILAAREAAINTYDQSAIAERGIGEQQQLGLANDNTQQAIAFNQDSTQLKETSLTTAADQAIADEEARMQEAEVQAQESVASQYASAQQTQASGGFWGSLLGGIGGLASILGFNLPTLGAGVGYVDSATGEPLSAAEYYDPSSIYDVVDPYSAIETQPQEALTFTPTVAP